ncbi:uncharacterized protein [Magallana gigas]|uniref:uncharacterized protein n=1 Tax=Magallana gigas TaxID=29159 RepID=UPI00333E42CC
MGLFGFSALCLFLTLCVQPGDLACTFPFTGTWVTSNRGTWTVTSSSIQNFKLRVNVAAASLYTMECFSSDGTYYVLKSTEIFYPFTTAPTYIYTCMTFSKQSDNKYLYTMNTEESTVVSLVFERVIALSTSAPAPAQSAVCTDTTNLGKERDHVALQSGFEVAAAVTCPTSIHGTWSYSYSGLTCSSTTLETCSDKTKFAYNNTECAENPMFSAAGTLYCVYSATSGDSTYVTLYNVDGSVTSPTTFQFSCMVRLYFNLIGCIFVYLRFEYFQQ